MKEKDLLGNYKLVLGLEIHLHLRTKRKMFCKCDANIYDSKPNTHTCPVCLGLPGALPVPNADAVEKTQMLGLALNCKLNNYSRFDRKHYMYPDLPKGYQISQYLQPLCGEGFLNLSSGTRILIERIHLEEDTAKSIHSHGKTMIDFNKSSMPLVEIVTHPIFETISDAVEFSKRVQDLVRILNIGDVDMEKGQMRLEANISLRSKEMASAGTLPNYKVEIKNINSFRFMEKAVLAEIKRQRELLESGQNPIQENRGYDENKNVTVSQRSKENAHDYRYFPEPDIPPMEFTEDHFVSLKNKLPELPEQIKGRLANKYKLSEKNSQYLTFGVGLTLLKKFEELAAEEIDAEKIANLLINKPEFRELSNADFVKRIKDDTDKISDVASLDEIVQTILKNNPSAIEDFKKGKQNALEFLLGNVMKETKGKASADVAREIIKKYLA